MTFLCAFLLKLFCEVSSNSHSSSDTVLVETICNRTILKEWHKGMMKPWYFPSYSLLFYLFFENWQSLEVLTKAPLSPLFLQIKFWILFKKIPNQCFPHMVINLVEGLWSNPLNHSYSEPSICKLALIRYLNNYILRTEICACNILEKLF